MTLTITQLYQLLSEKTDAQTAEVLTSYISEKVKTEIEDKTKVLATKEDIYSTKAEIHATKAEIKQAKLDMIKWFVGLFITLALMIIGLYLKIGEII